MVKRAAIRWAGYPCSLDLHQVSLACHGMQLRLHLSASRVYVLPVEVYRPSPVTQAPW
jgi:hypothetical protein